jgi:hypothetical protein
MEKIEKKGVSKMSQELSPEMENTNIYSRLKNSLYISILKAIKCGAFWICNIERFLLKHVNLEIYFPFFQ